MTDEPTGPLAGALADITSRFESLIEAAPDTPESISTAAPAPRNVASATGLPLRYRPEWPRPTDATWSDRFGKVMARVAEGGMIALIGPRGTGKTRIAAEAMRNYCPDRGSYTTAVGVFLRIRDTFGRKVGEREGDIVRELIAAPLLILDELQERGGTPWEDKVLTHVMDARYGAMRPTIVIANLTESALIEHLGDSIVSRLTETGGVMEITGPSHRVPH